MLVSSVYYDDMYEKFKNKIPGTGKELWFKISPFNFNCVKETFDGCLKGDFIKVIDLNIKQLFFPNS